MTLPSYKAVRKHTRYSLDVRAKLSNGEREITVRTLDICEGGLGLISPEEIAEGSVFTVKLVFPAVQGEFCAKVRAQTRMGFRHGFMFVGVDETNMALLVKYQRRWGIRADERYAGSE
jgi:hypothetical protein